MDAFFTRFFPRDGDALEGYHQAIRANLKKGSRRLLDLGCGDNTDLDAYRTANRHVWGVDFQAHPQLANRAWFRPLEADGRVPFPAGIFDGIASRWVLEHIADPTSFLREVGRLLRPGGWFVALTVNAATTSRGSAAWSICCRTRRSNGSSSACTAGRRTTRFRPATVLTRAFSCAARPCGPA